ncbi:DNA directed RNA polymerase subunit delta [Entomoplasma ellychniae]|uniref:RNAP delta factor n=1 Tax=Entomoplasma ellychniae TaxID=2114 RepID=A0A8E2UAQ7_9MOLU|nr:DNA-directed RNA polymerase subunit delta [Entomoplasma ellychniae]PPE04771.1 DNA directed RNA polymerase subunit delta [Entomoplasma ellychniae]
MTNKQNIDLAYDFLKKAKGPCKLLEVWEGIKAQVINNKSDENETIADLYSEMILDSRFALSKTQGWTVADGKKVENIKTELKITPKKPKDKSEEDSIDDEDEDLEVYDELFVEEEEEETIQVFYNEDED